MPQAQAAGGPPSSGTQPCTCSSTNTGTALAAALQAYLRKLSALLLEAVEGGGAARAAKAGGSEVRPPPLFP